MAKSIYLGNGKAIKIKKIYEGNGVARKIKKGYVGDSSGIARLFYNSSYRWERYIVITNYISKYYIYQPTVSNAGYSTFTFVNLDNNPRNWAYPNLQIVNTGGTVYSVHYSHGWVPGDTDYLEYSGFYSPIVRGSSVLTTAGFDVLLEVLEDNVSIDGSCTYKTYTETLNGNLNNWKLLRTEDYVQNKYPNSPDSKVYNRGITSLTQIEVPVLTRTTETSKGSYIDTVESDNENAYPNNGISGDYWYVKIT